MLCCHFLRLERYLLLLRLLRLRGINPSQICDRKSSPCVALVSCPVLTMDPGREQPPRLWSLGERRVIKYLFTQWCRSEGSRRPANYKRQWKYGLLHFSKEGGRYTRNVHTDLCRLGFCTRIYGKRYKPLPISVTARITRRLTPPQKVVPWEAWRYHRDSIRWCVGFGQVIASCDFGHTLLPRWLFPGLI